ncbi:porin [Roseiarcus sp.]|uniref:porin n=1 Tax=Roseiarcus sp. TaxID=1969460 RepID=UPI003F95FB68
MMKRLGIVLLATVGLAAMAQAADLPTTKAPAAAPPNCWSSFWTWLNSSASDCPLSAYGITLYGTLDVNGTYLSQGAARSPSADKVYYGIQKAANGPHYLFGYNGLSTNVVGLKMKEDILPYGWSLIGVLEAGVNPYSGMFFNGPRSLADNNLRPASTFPFQTTNLDSSRAGQWDNSQAYIGVSNPTWGTLTFGRTNTLAFDVMSAYDPVASTAFSLIGFSSSFPGFGDTETVRTTAVTYRLTYQNFRAAGQVTVGGYDWDNGASNQYQGQLGADFGPLSLDGVVSYAQNAVSLSTYGLNPYPSNSSLKLIDGDWFIIQKNIYGLNQYYNPNDILKATLSNNFGLEFTAKYKWNTVTFYAGDIYANLANPSSAYANGFQTIAGGIFVPSGAVSSTAYLNNGVVNAPPYAYNKVLNTIWTGFKWSILSNLDYAMGFYYQSQNNYNFTWNTGKISGVPYGYATSAACTGTGAFISSSKCAGSQDAVSAFLDYRPVPRVDIYGGVMLSNLYGGLANGAAKTYYAIPGNTKYSWQSAPTQSWDPTIGIRIRF